MLRRTTVALAAAAMVASVALTANPVSATVSTVPAASTVSLHSAEKASIQRAVAAEVAALAATYRIVSGDTLSGIASRYGTTWKNLWAANSFISNPDLIYPGQVLTISGSASGGSRQAPAAPAPAPAAASGWANPLPGACLGSPYGQWRGTYAHQGWDLPAGHGTPIRAAGSGQVHSANWQGGGGNTVIINHQNGVYTTYMHMSSFAVGGGQWVSPGQVIGYVGNTGDSSGPHLHLEVHWGGPWGGTVNPVQFLRDRGVWLGC